MQVSLCLKISLHPQDFRFAIKTFSLMQIFLFCLSSRCVPEPKDSSSLDSLQYIGGQWMEVLSSSLKFNNSHALKAFILHFN